MKRFISLISVFILVFATGNAAGGQKPTNPIPIKKHKAPENRPTLPGKDIETIHANISDDCITIVFEEPEGMATVSVTNDYDEVFASTIASTSAEIILSATLSPGIYYLEISTELNNEYYGYFFME